jgi:hypothetical protein
MSLYDYSVYALLRSNSPFFFFSFLLQRTIVPEDPFKFTYLRNLRLKLVVLDSRIRSRTDLLDYAYLLKIAPFMETLELHVSSFNICINSNS